MFSPGLNQMVREISLWGIMIVIFGSGLAFHQDIFHGLSGIVQLAEDQYKKNLGADTDELPKFENSVAVRSNPLGHFEVSGLINGQPTQFLADTGATFVALTYETAEQIGLRPNSLKFSGRTKTANGIAKVAPIIIDEIEVGGISIRNVNALVSEQGKLSVNLLGMSFMGKLDRVEMSKGNLILVK